MIFNKVFWKKCIINIKKKTQIKLIEIVVISRKSLNKFEKLVAGIAPTHWNTHATFDSCRMWYGWYTTRIMPSTWSRKYCAISWSTFSEWRTNNIILAITIRIVSLCFITFIRISVHPIDYKEWTPFLNTHHIEIWDNCWFRTILSMLLDFTCWPLQLWTLQNKLTPSSQCFVENIPNLYTFRKKQQRNKKWIWVIRRNSRRILMRFFFRFSFTFFFCSGNKFHAMFYSEQSAHCFDFITIAYWTLFWINYIR